ncbi:MAG TPA: hypothetical protein VIK84_06235 [Haloplasmataceae bacterium]
MLNNFINFIKFDDNKRIIVSVNESYSVYLQEEKNRQLLKKALIDLLQDDFEKLEVGKNNCRITVKAGTESTSIQKIQSSLKDSFGLIRKFMGM